MLAPARIFGIFVWACVRRRSRRRYKQKGPLGFSRHYGAQLSVRYYPINGRTEVRRYTHHSSLVTHHSLYNVPATCR